MRGCLIFAVSILVAGVLVGGDTDTLTIEAEPQLQRAYDEIVVTATRTRVPQWQTPVPVTVVTAEEINRRGGINLGDVLERSDALTFRRYGYGASLATMSLRGVAADQTVVLLNGIPVNSPQNGLVDLSTIPLSGIQRIEIVRGGMSSLYGNHAMGGVVNIITGGIGQEGTDVEITAGSGSFGLRRLNIKSEISGASSGVVFSLGRDQADGDFSFADPFQDDVVLRRENGDYVQTHISVDGTLRLDTNTRIQAFSRYAQTDRGVPGAFFGQQADNRQEDEHLHIGLVLDRSITDNVVMELRPFFLYSDLLYVAPAWDYSSRSINRQYGAAFDVTATLNRTTLVTVGGEITHAGIDADGLAKNVERVNTVAYIAGQWNPTLLNAARVSVFPSIRYDRFSNNRKDGERRVLEELSWKLGGTFQPFQNQPFLLRGSVGRNFKAPSLNDLYWVPGGNEELVPEYSNNVDFGIRWRVPFVSDFVVDAGLFIIWADNRIIWLPDPETQLWSPKNVRRVHADGFEIDLRWKPSVFPPLRIGASYTYQDVRQFIEDPAEGGEITRRLPFVPHHILSSEVGVQFGNVELFTFPRYTSKRYTTEANDDSIDGYFLLDFRGSYTVELGTIATTVSLDVRNIFDRDYEVMQYYPMPGRHYELSVRLRY